MPLRKIMQLLILRLSADLVVFLHCAYVLFVLLGAMAIMVGWWRRWKWVRNPWFRVLHLGAIGAVVAESWLGIVCPLTDLENYLRRQAGETTYPGAFFGHWIHALLFIDAEAWVLSLLYTAFLGLVLAGWWLAPPGPTMSREKR